MRNCEDLQGAVKFCYPRWVSPRTQAAKGHTAAMDTAGGAMSKVERIYRCTEAGERARQDTEIPEADRQILGLLEGGAHWLELRKRLPRLDDHHRLADLQARGLVVAHAAEAESDLDFTGNFTFSKS